MSYAIHFTIYLYYVAFAEGVTEWVNKDGWIHAVERSSLAMRNPSDFLGWVRQQRNIEQLQRIENDLLEKEHLVGTVGVGDVNKLVKHDICRTVDFQFIKEDLEFHEGFVLDLNPLKIDLRQHLRSGVREFDKIYPDRRNNMRLAPLCDIVAPLDYSPFTYEHLAALQSRSTLNFDEHDSPRFFDMIREELIRDPDNVANEVEPEQVTPEEPIKIRIIEEPRELSDAESFEIWSMRIAKTLAVRPTDWLAHLAASYAWRIRGDAPRALECARRAIHFAPTTTSANSESRVSNSDAYRNMARFSLAGVLHGTRQVADALHVLISMALSDPLFTGDLAELAQLNVSSPPLSPTPSPMEQTLQDDSDSMRRLLSNRIVALESVFEQYRHVRDSPKCVNLDFDNPDINSAILFRAVANALVANSRFDAALITYGASVRIEPRFSEMLEPRRLRIACYLEVLEALRKQKERLDDALRELDDVDAFTSRYLDAQRQIDTAAVDELERVDQRAFYDRVRELELTRGCPINNGLPPFATAGVSGRGANAAEYLAEADVHASELHAFEVDSDSFERSLDLDSSFDSDVMEPSSAETEHRRRDQPMKDARRTNTSGKRPSTTSSDSLVCDIDTMLSSALEFELAYLPVDPGGAIAQRAVYTMTAERLISQASRLRDRERGALLSCRDLPIAINSFHMDRLAKRYRSLVDTAGSRIRSRGIEDDLFDFFQSQLPFARDLHIDDVANVLVIMHQQRLVPEWYVLELAAFYHHLKADYAAAIECALLALAHADLNRPLVLANLATLLLRLNASASAKQVLEYELRADIEACHSNSLEFPGGAHVHYLYAVALFRTHNYTGARKHFEMALRSRLADPTGNLVVQAALPSIDRAMQHIRCAHAQEILSSQLNCSAISNVRIDFMRPPQTVLWLPELTVLMRRRFLEYLRQTSLKPTRSLFVAFDKNSLEQTYQRIPLDDRPSTYQSESAFDDRDLLEMGPVCVFQSLEEKETTYLELLNMSYAELLSIKAHYQPESDLEAFLRWTIDLDIYSDEKRLAAPNRTQIGSFLERMLTQRHGTSTQPLLDEQLQFVAQLLAAVYWRVEGELEKALDCALLATRSVDRLFDEANAMFPDASADEERGWQDVPSVLWRFANELFVTIGGYDFELRKLRALPRVVLAGALTNAQRATLAEQQLEEAVSSFPEAALVHFARANLYALRREWPHAKRSYLDALTRSTAPFPAAFNRLQYLLCVTDRVAERSQQ